MINKTPKFFTRLFKWFCKDDFFEELQGDLEERFLENEKVHGLPKAKRTYGIEVLKMIRPSIIRTPKAILSLTQLSLFQIHLKLAFRNIYRHRVFSLVNILSLATATTLCLFAVNMIYTGHQADSQHKRAEGIYRVTTKVESPQNTIAYATSSYALTKHLRDIPQIEEASFFITYLDANFTVKGGDIELRGYSVDQGFLNLFNFEVVEGDLQNIFNDPRSIAITDKAAKKLFGNESAIGKTNEEGVIIKAVITSPEKSSQFKFDFLYNRIFQDSFLSPKERQERLTAWDDYLDTSYNYFRLAENANIADVKAQLARVNTLMNEQTPGASQYTMEVQGLTSIMFGDSLSMDLQNVHPRITLMVLLSIIIVLTLLASFNYTNLSIARSLQRSKEMGIRRITGSSRWQIITQLITETCIFSFIALGLALLAYRLILSDFEQHIVQFDTLLSPELNPGMLLWFVLFCLLVGVFAGLLPAIHFSKIAPLRAIQHKLKTSTASLSNIKRVLTGVQLGVSTLCILFIVIINDQKEQVFNADLGFESNGLIALPVKGIDLKLLKAQLDNIPEVASYTATSMIPGTLATRGRIIISTDLQDTSRVHYALVDPLFPKVYSTEIKVGPGFTADTSDEILVDDLFLKAMNIPADSAIGTQVYLNEYRTKVPVKITGILKGYNTTGLYDYNIPMVLRNHYDSTLTNTITLDIVSGNLPATLKKIEAGWKIASNGQVFSPIFVDDAIKKTYATFFGLMQTIELGGIAIVLIAILGQFGIALFSAESRIKEISVRKVLGASFGSLIKLFSENTLLTLILTTSIALPLTYYLFQTFVMPSFSVPLSISVIKIVGGLLALWSAIIGIVIVQTWQTTRINPAETLKSE